MSDGDREDIYCGYCDMPLLDCLCVKEREDEDEPPTPDDWLGGIL